MSTDGRRFSAEVREYALEKQRVALADSGQSLFSFGRSVCHLRVIDRGSAGLMVFATDVDVNPGPSMTNAVELLAKEIRERVSKGLPFDLVLCHPEGDPLGTGKTRYSSVTFRDTLPLDDPQFEPVAAATLMRRVGTIPSIDLTPDELGWLNSARAAEEAERIAEEERARDEFQIVQLTALRGTDVSVERRYRGQRWTEIAAAACAAFLSGVDPLDDEQLLRIARETLPGKMDQRGFMSLFSAPICIGESGSYVNGRHRVQAMREAGVVECVVTIAS